MDDFLDLIYSSVVKNKLSSLPKNKKFDLKENTNNRLIGYIDKYMSYVIKFIILILILSLFIKLNVYIVMLSLILYIAYKKYVNIKLKELLKDKRMNFECKFNGILTDTAKLKIKGLIIIIILFNFSVYKKIYISIFIALLVFTIYDVYSNIKNRTNDFQNQ